MLCKLVTLVLFVFLQNVVFSRHELDTEFPEFPIYWYNATGVISGNMTFACSILTSSKPTVMWMNEENLLTDLWMTRNPADVVFSFKSWQDCICVEAIDSGSDESVQRLIYKPSGFSTINQVTVSFHPNEILHSTCMISQNTQETAVLWEFDIKDDRANFIPHNTESGNGISIDQMQILIGSKFDDKLYTCNMSDFVFVKEYLMTDDTSSIDTQVSCNNLSNCSTTTDCMYMYNDIFLECKSDGCCDCVTGYAYDASESRCIYNYYLNITVAAIAFSVLLGVMFFVWCATMIVRSYRRRILINTQLSPQSSSNPGTNFQLTSTNGSGSRTRQPSLDTPPAYFEIERSETPPPTFESIYSMELKVVTVDNETSTQENPVENIYAICDTQENSEIKLDT